MLGVPRIWSPGVVGFVRVGPRGIPPFALRASTFALRASVDKSVDKSGFGGRAKGKLGFPLRRLPVITPGQSRWRWDIRDVKDQAEAGGDGEGPRPGLRGLVVRLLASLLQKAWRLGGFLV